jgi:hypothetical protein
MSFLGHTIPAGAERNDKGGLFKTEYEQGADPPERGAELGAAKNPFDSGDGEPLKCCREVESESAAIEGAADKRRGGWVLNSH